MFVWVYQITYKGILAHVLSNTPCKLKEHSKKVIQEGGSLRKVEKVFDMQLVIFVIVWNRKKKEVGSLSTAQNKSYAQVTASKTDNHNFEFNPKSFQSPIITYDKIKRVTDIGERNIPLTPQNHLRKLFQSLKEQSCTP